MVNGQIVSVTNLDEIERARGRVSMQPGNGNASLTEDSIDLPTESSADSDAAQVLVLSPPHPLCAYT